MIKKKQKKYKKKKKQFEKEIKEFSKFKIFYYKYNLTKEEKLQIEKWTNKKIGEIIFDSNKDNWSKYTSVFGDKIFEKEQFILLIEDTDGNKFGFYLNTKVERKYCDWSSTDNNSFLFSLQSNGRIKEGMMKFEYKHGKGIWVGTKINSILFSVGGGSDIGIKNQNEKSSCWCNQNNSYWNYHGYQNALCGGYNFTLKRFIVIQMK